MQAQTQKKVETQGKITKTLSMGIFEVKLGNDLKALVCLSGKMRINNIRVLPGDEVTVELSPYDLTRGKIISKGKNAKK